MLIAIYKFAHILYVYAKACSAVNRSFHVDILAEDSGAIVVLRWMVLIVFIRMFITPGTSINVAFIRLVIYDHMCDLLNFEYKSCDGERVRDRTANIYVFGCVLWELMVSTFSSHLNTCIYI